MISEEEDGIWLEFEESIAAHHEDVFGCLTSSVGLSRWFPVAAEVDLRPGGQIVFCWDEKCTRKSTMAILDYDAGGYVVWDWYADNTDTHAPIYWTVDPDTEQGAIVRFRQGPFKTDRDALIGLASEAAHWSWHLCNLRGVLEARHDMRKVRPL